MKVAKAFLKINHLNTSPAPSQQPPARMPWWRRRNRGLTRIELLAILGGMALLVAVALPLLANPALASQRAVCANNLRQIARAFGVFASNNDNQLPWMKTNNAPINHYFIWAGAELGDTRIVVCPADAARSAALNFSNVISFVANRHLSYLLNIESRTHQAGAWLSGDQNQSANNKITSSANCAWTASQNHGTEGNVVTVDGRVEQLNTPGLRTFVDGVLARDYPITLRIP